MEAEDGLVLQAVPEFMQKKKKAVSHQENLQECFKFPSTSSEHKLFTKKSFCVTQKNYVVLAVFLFFLT